jgi:acetyl-CoA carboxylase carboxyl transferase subunit alpha
VSTMDEHSDPRLKITVADLSNEQRRNLGADEQGVLVTTLDEGPAANAGLYPTTSSCKSIIARSKAPTSSWNWPRNCPRVRRSAAGAAGKRIALPGRALARQGMTASAMNPNNCLDFEKPIAELEAMLKELRHLSAEQDLNIGDEIARLEAKSKALTDSIFASLTPWQISQIARHPLRPYTLDYVERLFTDFQELHGDRTFADDHAIVGGLARLDGRPVLVIGHQKGRDTKEKIYRNFGMPRPEGYRKALRLMKLAERFRLPVLTFIDTPGAYPGIGAEERGQSEAIARNLFEMSRLRVPIICVVIGEGGSGGALAIGVGDRVLMLQYGTYSVISPEGCAAILWKSADRRRPRPPKRWA